MINGQDLVAVARLSIEQENFRYHWNFSHL